jgi:hypothetical protein
VVPFKTEMFKKGCAQIEKLAVAVLNNSPA